MKKIPGAGQKRTGSATLYLSQLFPVTTMYSLTFDDIQQLIVGGQQKFHTKLLQENPAKKQNSQVENFFNGKKRFFIPETFPAKSSVVDSIA